MSKALSLTGTLQFQPTDAARLVPIPVAFSGLPYSQYSQQELVFVAAQTNVPLADGTITAPRFVFVEVTTGSVDISKDVGGANPFTIGANPTPAASETAGFLMLYTYGANGPLYLTTPGPAQVRVWFFQ